MGTRVWGPQTPAAEAPAAASALGTGTTITADVAGFETGCDTYAGAIDGAPQGATIVKAGPANLILNEAGRGLAGLVGGGDHQPTVVGDGVIQSDGRRAVGPDWWTIAASTSSATPLAIIVARARRR